MKKNIGNLVDFFIHPNLKINKSTYEKSRITIFAFLGTFIIGMLYDCYFFLKGYRIDIKAFHNYLGVSIVLLGLLIIKFSGKTNFALSLVAILSVYLVSASVYLSGGVHSNDMLWYIVLSSMSFMFVGARVGVIITTLSFIGMTFFYALEIINNVHLIAITASLTSEYIYFNFVLILLILTFMIYNLVRGNNKLQEIVQQGKEQKVREEIARDFHDQIGNKLASLRHLAELVGMNKTPMEREQALSKIDENAKDVYDNFRDFIWTLDPKSDQLVELFMYLRDFADDYFKFSAINIYINSTPDQLPEITLPSYYSKEIVPLFKEALTNIYKHSKAKNIHLDFIVSKTTLTIHLLDDGIGINESALKLGNGLINMKHRAQKTRGTLSISSSTKGTEILYSVLLPLKGNPN